MPRRLLPSSKMQSQLQRERDSERANGPAWKDGKMWCEWRAQMQSLRDALQSKSPDARIWQLINQCMALYRTACSVPPTTDDLLASISGRNSSLFEAAFMWLGAWRPTSAITLVYSKMGVIVRESDGHVENVTPACTLSKSQLAAIEMLRNITEHAESEITNGLASLQMLVADQNMAAAIGIGSPTHSISSSTLAHRLMDNKLALLHSLYMQSNRLRLQTLQELVHLLTPTQAAQCVISAFELVYAMKMLGDTASFHFSSPAAINSNSSSR